MKKDINYWRQLALEEQIQKSYYQELSEQLKLKLIETEGKLQDLQCDHLHVKHINEILKLVIEDS